MTVRGLPPRSSSAGLCGSGSQRGSSGSFPPPLLPGAEAVVPPHPPLLPPPLPGEGVEASQAPPLPRGAGRGAGTEPSLTGGGGVSVVSCRLARRRPSSASREAPAGLAAGVRRYRPAAAGTGRRPTPPLPGRGAGGGRRLGPGPRRAARRGKEVATFRLQQLGFPSPPAP